MTALASILSGTLLAASFPGAAPAYRKIEMRIPMRDGVRLNTQVYVPLDPDRDRPILLERTPYSAGPYGTKTSEPSPDDPYAIAKYVIVTQDVRGRYMSEGDWENVRPLLPPGVGGPTKIDEATDTYDTIEYLVRNVPRNNGKVGMRGISYPGFYVGTGAISRHPALAAVSPQAPVSDWWKGDDVHHNGAFFVQDNWDFSQWFDVPRSGLEEDHSGLPPYDRGPGGAYGFYLRMGNSANLDTKIAKGRVPYWKEIGEHPNYDQYWKARELPTKMANLKCAVLTVGGWFDGENLWGALNVYKETEKRSPGIVNALVMGPWSHGQWAGGPGDRFAAWSFGQPTGEKYRTEIEAPFFAKYLDGADVPAPAEATVFETGANRWRTFPTWPPATTPVSFALGADGVLGSSAEGKRGFTVDPSAPTPYVADWKTSPRRPASYMGQDERFLDGRADVADWRGAVLTSPMTVAGPITADLYVTTTGTDGDLFVKVIDEFPDGSRKMVRWEVIRMKFRDSASDPSPMVPGKPTRVRYALNDVMHSFEKGHRPVVRVQGAMFPLVERHPHVFGDVFAAKPGWYRKATVRVLSGSETPSRLIFGALK